MIREIKPKKAKRAFEVSMSVAMFSYGRRLAAMQAVLESVPQADRESESTYWTEYKNGMGTYKLTLYVNDDELAEKLSKAMDAI